MHERKLHVRKGGSVKEAAGDRKNFEFEGGCGRFASKHWRHRPRPCAAINQNGIAIDIA